MADRNPVGELLEFQRPGEKAHQERLTRYDRAYRTYRALPEHNAPKIPEWRSRTRVPYAQQVIDTALVNIVSGSPRCIVHPRHPDDVASAKAMQQLLDYFTGEDHLTEKQALFAQQGLIFGVTVAKNHWLYTETEKLVWQTVTDPLTGAGRREAQTVPLVTRDGPCFEPWSVYDCWWDPNARDVDTAQYIVLRSWKTRRELERQAYDEDSGMGRWRNLSQLFENGPGKTRETSAQESFLGTADNKRKDAYEILEVWTDDRVVVIGERSVELLNDPNPYWHGLKPVVIAQTRPDLFEMQGIPETDLVQDIQAAMHTLQNMTIDSLHLTVMRGVTYREGSVVDPNAIQLRPLFKWAVSDHDDIRPFEVPQLGSDVYNERARLLADMERVTGITAYLSGADSATVNQTTATGVTALQGAANTLLRFKAKQIHDKGYQRTYEQWGEMIQQFLDKPTWVKITGIEQAQDLQQSGLEVTGSEQSGYWANVKPQDVVGSFHYRLEGSEEALTQQSERNEAISLLNATVPLILNGKMNADPLIERIGLAFDVADPKSLLPQPPPQAPQAEPQAQPGQPQTPQAAGTLPQPLMNGQQMPIPVQQAISG